MKITYAIYAMLLILCVGTASATMFKLDAVIPSSAGCSIFGCTMQGDINMSGYNIVDANLVNPGLVEHDPIFTAQNATIWSAINAVNDSLANYYPITNPQGFINASTANDTFVKVAGDTMTGDLNMSNHSIWEVDTLSVHNITGRSPIYVNSPMISGNSITAATFYGDIQGTNGTIFGVTINNGTIENLHVTGNDAMFDGNVIVNGSVNASDYNFEGDGKWIYKNGLVINFNETTLQSLYYNKTEIDQLLANLTNQSQSIINNTNIELMTCDGTCTTIVEVEYI